MSTDTEKELRDARSVLSLMLGVALGMMLVVFTVTPMLRELREELGKVASA